MRSERRLSLRKRNLGSLQSLPSRNPRSEVGSAQNPRQIPTRKSQRSHRFDPLRRSRRRRRHLRRRHLPLLRKRSNQVPSLRRRRILMWENSRRWTSTCTLICGILSLTRSIPLREARRAYLSMGRCRVSVRPCYYRTLTWLHCRTTKEHFRLPSTTANLKFPQKVRNCFDFQTLVLDVSIDNQVL